MVDGVAKFVECKPVKNSDGRRDVRMLAFNTPFKYHGSIVARKAVCKTKNICFNRYIKFLKKLLAEQEEELKACQNKVNTTNYKIIKAKEALSNIGTNGNS